MSTKDIDELLKSLHEIDPNGDNALNTENENIKQPTDENIADETTDANQPIIESEKKSIDDFLTAGATVDNEVAVEPTTVESAVDKKADDVATSDDFNMNKIKPAEVINNPEPQEKKAKKAKKAWIIATIVLLIVAGIGGAYYYFSLPLTPEQIATLNVSGTFLPGVKIMGQDVGGLTRTQAKEKVSANFKSQSDKVLLTLTLDDKKFEIKFSEIEPTIAIDNVLDEAMLFGRNGDVFKKMSHDSQLKGEGKDFEIGLNTNIAAVKARLETIAKEATVPAKNATMTSGTSNENMVFVEGKNGIKVDSEELYKLVESKIKSGDNSNVPIPYTVSEPSLTVNDLKENVTLISSFSTTITGSAGRVKNIKKATAITDGTVVHPGNTYDIEKHLGARTAKNGWFMAPEIVDGLIQPGYGGGICQVSSTLFNAALYANMEIVERRNHSIPSSYIKIGFDAAISLGGPYLRIKNTTDFPIYIFGTTTNGVIKFSIFGKQLPWGSGTTYERKSTIKQGSSGKSVESTLIYKDKDGKEVKKKTWDSFYPTKKEAKPE